MRERCDGLRLALETLLCVRIPGRRGWQDLDCHLAVKARIARAIHLAHPASADQRQDLYGPSVVPAASAICSRPL